MARTTQFVQGYEEALRQWEALDGLPANDNANDADNYYINPFLEGSEQHRGFEEGVYDLTQK